MKRSLAALALLLLPLAAQASDTEFTIDSFVALSVEQRSIYVAALADALDLAAAMAPENSHLPVLAECTHGYGRDALLSALDAGGRETASEWTGDAPAALWFVDTMIYVCQLRLPMLQPPG